MITANTRRAVTTLEPGVVIDAYEVGEQLEDGDSGSVYLARDRRLGRDIALRLHATTSGNDSWREATALAQITHPNLVTIYEVGTWADHPWMATEYVPGGNARTWLAAARRTAREIVALYLVAGRGLAAAHAAGLVHGAFKPEVVRVGNDGRIRVADFGIESTNTAYLAPEQHHGEVVGPAVDQFAFAIALWESLTGTRPFADATQNHQILQPARALDRSIERILRRALQSDPIARWPSMTALIAELGARSTHRGRTVALAVFGIAGVAFGLAGIAEARRDDTSCTVAGERTRWTAARRSEVSAALANRANAGDVDRVVAIVDDWVGRWRSQRVATCEDGAAALLDLQMYCLDRADAELEATLGSLATLPANQIGRASELARKLPRLEDCLDPRPAAGPRIAADPSLRATLHAALARAKVLGTTGEHRRALIEARTAVAIAETIGEPAGTAEAQLALARALYNLGDMHDVLATFENAARIAGIAGDDELVARAWIAALDTVAQRLQKPSEADRLVAAAEAAVARAGDRPELRADLLRARGDLLVLRDDYRGAIALLERGLAIREQLNGIEAIETTGSLTRLANAHVQLQDLEPARALIARFLTIVETNYGPNHPYIAVGLGQRGSLEINAGEFAAARATLERALELKQQTLGAEHPGLVPTLINLALALEAVDQIEPAKRTIARAIALAEKALGPEHPQVAHARGILGGLEIRAGRWDAAETELARAIAIEEATGEQSETLAESLVKLARCRAQRRDFAGGRSLLDRALAIATKAEPESMVVADALERRGQLEHAAGNPGAARVAIERAMTMVEHVAGRNHPVFKRLDALLRQS